LGRPRAASGIAATSRSRFNFGSENGVFILERNEDGFFIKHFAAEIAGEAHAGPIAAAVGEIVELIGVLTAAVEDHADAAGSHRATAAQLEEKIAELRPLAVDSERWEEMASEASGIKTATLATLEGMLEKAKQAEEDARELQRLKDAEVKRKQEENDERLRKEGEQRALLAQQQAQAPQVVVPIPQTLQPAEQASASSGEPAKGPWFPAAMLPPGPIQVIEATPLTFPQADSLRRGEPVSYSQEASAVEHRRGFNREALADLQAAIIAPASGVQDSEDAAKAILTAIVTGKVRHIAITY